MRFFRPHFDTSFGKPIDQTVYSLDIGEVAAPVGVAVVARNSSKPMMAERVEPKRTPIRERVLMLSLAFSNANPDKNIDIVKPIPHSTETAKICFILTNNGSLAIFNFTAIKQKLNTPSGFPMNNPSMIPNGKASPSVSKLTPLNGTPALAKANIGRIKNADHGFRACSSVSRGLLPSRAVIGIVKPRITPANVACTPDFNTQTHNTMPTNK